MRKSNFVLIPIFLFLFGFIYLNNKIEIYIQAYELGKNYKKYNEYLDKRDYLLYNYVKNFPLEKLNEWVEENKFVSVKNNKVLVRVKKEEYQSKNILFAFLDRFKDLGSGLKSAFAKGH